MVKCLPEFVFFTVFLKNKNIIFKTRRSKVTDNAALIDEGTGDSNTTINGPSSARQRNAI